MVLSSQFHGFAWRNHIFQWNISLTLLTFGATWWFITLSKYRSWVMTPVISGLSLLPKTKDITYLAGWSSRHGKTRKRVPTKGNLSMKNGQNTWHDNLGWRILKKYWLNQLAINYKGATVEARQRVTAILRIMWQYCDNSQEQPPFFPSVALLPPC